MFIFKHLYLSDKAESVTCKLPWRGFCYRSVECLLLSSLISVEHASGDVIVLIVVLLDAVITPVKAAARCPLAGGLALPTLLAKALVCF
jgi:hypothetical protein